MGQGVLGALEFEDLDWEAISPRVAGLNGVVSPCIMKGRQFEKNGKPSARSIQFNLDADIVDKFDDENNEFFRFNFRFNPDKQIFRFTPNNEGKFLFSVNQTARRHGVEKRMVLVPFPEKGLVFSKEHAACDFIIKERELFIHANGIYRPQKKSMLDEPVRLSPASSTKQY